MFDSQSDTLATITNSSRFHTDLNDLNVFISNLFDVIRAIHVQARQTMKHVIRAIHVQARQTMKHVIRAKLSDISQFNMSILLYYEFVVSMNYGVYSVV